MQSHFLPADATWVGVMLLIIAALFIAAAVIGGVARAVMPERYVEEPPDKDHESTEETLTEPNVA